MHLDEDERFLAVRPGAAKAKVIAKRPALNTEHLGKARLFVINLSTALFPPINMTIVIDNITTVGTRR
jgi:hypothetical protein